MTELEMLRRIVRLLESDRTFVKGMLSEKGLAFESKRYWAGREVGADGMAESVRKIVGPHFYSALADKTQDAESE